MTLLATTFLSSRTHITADSVSFSKSMRETSTDETEQENEQAGKIQGIQELQYLGIRLTASSSVIVASHPHQQSIDNPLNNQIENDHKKQGWATAMKQSQQKNRRLKSQQILRDRK